MQFFSWQRRQLKLQLSSIRLSHLCRSMSCLYCLIDGVKKTLCFLSVLDLFNRRITSESLSWLTWMHDFITDTNLITGKILIQHIQMGTVTPKPQSDITFVQLYAAVIYHTDSHAIWQESNMYVMFGQCHPLTHMEWNHIRTKPRYAKFEKQRVTISMHKLNILIRQNWWSLSQICASEKC